MFNRVKYFITKNFKNPSTKEKLNKIKNKVNNNESKFIIIRKYHTSNTNFNNNFNGNKPPNYSMIIICSLAIGAFFSIKKNL